MPRRWLPPAGPCSQCGQVHVTGAGGRACSGHISIGAKGQPAKPRAGGPCTNAPMHGQDVCGSHGGRAPRAKAAATRRVAEERVIETARKLIPDVADRARIANPLETLLDLASEANAFRESLRLLANDVEQIRTTGAGGSEQLRAEVATYRLALRDVTDVLVAIAKLDIETTLARIEARKVDQVIGALSAGLDEAQLSNDQKRAVMAGVGRHLRSVRRPAA